MVIRNRFISKNALLQSVKMTNSLAAMKEPTTRDIIEALGGVNHVSNKICVERIIIDNWMRPDRRIGAAYWIDILALARRQKVTWITAETLRKARGAYARKQHEPV